MARQVGQLYNILNSEVLNVNIETIHTSVVNGNRQQVARQISEYGVLAFVTDYREFLAERLELELPYYSSAIKSYFTFLPAVLVEVNKGMAIVTQCPDGVNVAIIDKDERDESDKVIDISELIDVPPTSYQKGRAKPTETAYEFYCDQCKEKITARHLEINLYDLDEGLPQWFRTVRRLCLECAHDMPIALELGGGKS